MTTVKRAADRLERKRHRQHEGYLRTATRLLVEVDRKAGVPGNMLEAQVAYENDSALRRCIADAVTQVAPCHVPGRAVKLYCRPCK